MSFGVLAPPRSQLASLLWEGSGEECEGDGTGPGGGCCHTGRRQSDCSEGEPNGKGKVAILSLTQSLAHGYRSELMNRAPNYVHSGDMEEVGDPAVAP